MCTLDLCSVKIEMPSTTPSSTVAHTSENPPAYQATMSSNTKSYLPHRAAERRPEVFDLTVDDPLSPVQSKSWPPLTVRDFARLMLKQKEAEKGTKTVVEKSKADKENKDKQGMKKKKKMNEDGDEQERVDAAGGSKKRKGDPLTETTSQPENSGVGRVTDLGSSRCGRNRRAPARLQE